VIGPAGFLALLFESLPLELALYLVSRYISGNFPKSVRIAHRLSVDRTFLTHNREGKSPKEQGAAWPVNSSITWKA
jgi:hypothetical protein